MQMMGKLISGGHVRKEHNVSPLAAQDLFVPLYFDFGMLVFD